MHPQMRAATTAAVLSPRANLCAIRSMTTASPHSPTSQRWMAIKNKASEEKLSSRANARRPATHAVTRKRCVVVNCSPVDAESR